MDKSKKTKTLHWMGMCDIFPFIDYVKLKGPIYIYIYIYTFIYLYLFFTLELSSYPGLKMLLLNMEKFK